ncbi:glycosyltransferase [Christiangramia salexigens]|uniref:Glycosyltransferase 2-like domain-containing protein n=1 Tax=Christiangramia salexigens TaxID=1913577 RepID=A0A1L3J5L5_9FLAO|nr:glycosyltransferase [Christiangramia salexigens]APG60428.1 hypothetical protein LPB144_08430 [Christiangramia salexigens]
MISVVTTCWNELETIGLWINDIENQSEFPAEIIIVDNLSTDGTLEILNSWKENFKKSKIKIISKKCSVSKGRDIAIKNSSFPFILSSDIGTRINNNWVKSFSLLIKKDPSLELVIGNYYFIRTHMSELTRNYDRLMKGERSNLNINSLGSNRNILYSRELYDKVGGMPTHLKFAGDDTYLSKRLIECSSNTNVINEPLVGWIRPIDKVGLYKEARAYGFGDGQISHMLSGKEDNLYNRLNELIKILFYGFMKIIKYSVFWNWILLLCIHSRRTFIYFVAKQKGMKQKC